MVADAEVGGGVIRMWKWVFVDVIRGNVNVYTDIYVQTHMHLQMNIYIHI